MKKILAVVLGILVLAGGLLGCKHKEPEPDSHEGLYGTYKMVAIDLYIKGKGTYESISLDSLPSAVSVEDREKVKVFIQEIIGKAGDTITISKDKIKFSGGSLEPEFEYRFEYSDTIFIDTQTVIDMGFTFSSVRYDTFDNYTPPKYQLVTHGALKINETFYSIDIYYSRQY